jgi:hypothetical protein
MYRFALKLKIIKINRSKLRNLKMSKRELIDCIREINQTASAEFLALFNEEQLQQYLEHLMELDLKELAVAG